MSGLAEDAVYEARKVLEDLAGYLRAVGFDLTDESTSRPAKAVLRQRVS